MRRVHPAWLLALLVGCGGGSSSVLDGYHDSTGTADEMKAWASGASAAALYAQALTPLFVAGLAGQNSTCPKVTKSGTTQTYAGGCTDSNGNVWAGTAVVTAGTAQAPAHIEYDSFGYTGNADGCTGKRATTSWKGTVDETPGTASTDFTIELRLAIDGFDKNNGCAALTDSLGVDYTGTLAVSGPSNMQVQTFDGSGQVGSTSRGLISASTSAEVVDSNTCSTEAMSGTTTLSASGHTAVITYDGATSCDQTSTVTWTYDGADQGELAGVSCAAGGGASGGASALLVLGAVALARRRRGYFVRSQS